MELRDGRGSQLEVGDTPFIAVDKIQPLSTNPARDMRYYRSRGNSRGRDLPDLGAVLPLARYYRSPLRYYRKAGKSFPMKSADEINYIRAYFR